MFWFWTQVLWHFPRRPASWELAYHGFNLLEGGVWEGFALVTLWRALRRGGACLEWPFALAFLSFGVTDFLEAYRVTPGLVVFKALNCGMLLWIRAAIHRRDSAGRELPADGAPPPGQGIRDPGRE